MLNYKAPLHTTKYFLYYKVLLQDCSVLQSTIPVLQNTTLCNKVLAQYYKAPLCTTQYYSSTTKYYSTTTKYYTTKGGSGQHPREGHAMLREGPAI